MIKFILSVIHGDKPTSIDFAEWIKDGMTLMNLLTTLDFNSVPSDPFTNLGGLNPEVTRIKTLIEAIENYGVDKKYLFTVEDLFEKKHIPRVVRCLEEIEKLARQEEHVNFASMPVNRVYY